MYHIKEGENEAIIYLNRDLIDVETIKQIRKMITHPAIEHARIMPDCHRGMGCCVGFTAQINDKIVPNFIGGDIGCGILAYELPNLLPHKNSHVQLEKLIKQLIPMGNGHEHIYPQP